MTYMTVCLRSQSPLISPACQSQPDNGRDILSAQRDPPPHMTAIDSDFRRSSGPFPMRSRRISCPQLAARKSALVLQRYLCDLVRDHDVCMVVDLVAGELHAVHERISGRFARAEPRARVREYVSGWSQAWNGRIGGRWPNGRAKSPRMACSGRRPELSGSSQLTPARCVVVTAIARGVTKAPPSEAHREPI
jgi:hypothetical protein